MSAQKTVEEVLSAECARYGLPTEGDPARLLEALLKHIYANHDLTIAVYKQALDLSTQIKDWGETK